MIVQTANGYRPIGDSLPRKTWRTGAGYAEAPKHTPVYPWSGVQGEPCTPTAPADARALAGQAIP